MIPATPEPKIPEDGPEPEFRREFFRDFEPRDVMFVDEVPFLVSVSRGINLIIAEFTPVCTAKNLAANIKHILQVYMRGGFKVSTLLMDNEFDCLVPLLPQLVVNTPAAREHVTDIERRIRTRYQGKRTRYQECFALQEATKAHAD
jgi:hypothetical protein